MCANDIREGGMRRYATFAASLKRNVKFYSPNDAPKYFDLQPATTTLGIESVNYRSAVSGEGRQKRAYLTSRNVFVQAKLLVSRKINDF